MGGHADKDVIKGVIMYGKVCRNYESAAQNVLTAANMLKITSAVNTGVQSDVHTAFAIRTGLFEMILKTCFVGTVKGLNTLLIFLHQITCVAP